MSSAVPLTGIGRFDSTRECVETNNRVSVFAIDIVDFPTTVGFI